MTMTRTCASSLIVASILIASGSAVAQQPYPDIKGTWTGEVRRIVQGTSEHHPELQQGDRPVFSEEAATFTFDRQEGERFTGSYGMAARELRDPLLGIFQADRKTIHMVDDDGTFSGTLTAPDTMEVCRAEVDADSRGVYCYSLTRQR